MISNSSKPIRITSLCFRFHKKVIAEEAKVAERSLQGNHAIPWTQTQFLQALSKTQAIAILALTTTQKTYPPRNVTVSLVLARRRGAVDVGHAGADASVDNAAEERREQRIDVLKKKLRSKQ